MGWLALRKAPKLQKNPYKEAYIPRTQIASCSNPGPSEDGGVTSSFADALPFIAIGFSAFPFSCRMLRSGESKGVFMIPEGDRRNGAACFCRAIEMARSRNAESWAECTKEKMPGPGGQKRGTKERGGQPEPVVESIQRKCQGNRLRNVCRNVCIIDDDDDAMCSVQTPRAAVTLSYSIRAAPNAGSRAEPLDSGSSKFYRSNLKPAPVPRMSNSPLGSLQ